MTPATPTLTIKRLLHAPLARVFATWTTPGEIARWLGGETWKPLGVSVDLRVGGAYSVRLENAGEQIVIRGEYRVIEAPTRLVFTWRQDGDNAAMSFGETLVTVDLIDVNGSTEVHITHEGFANDELREQHVEGWMECLENMGGLVLAEPQPA